MNSSLDTLMASVSQLSTLYNSMDRGDHSPFFLSQLNLHEYGNAEEKFTGELTTYTKKQFFEVIL